MSTVLTVSEPFPYWGLVPGIAYYLLQSSSILNRVVLVSFEERVHKSRRVRVCRTGVLTTKTVGKPKSRYAKLSILPRDQFEALLDLDRPMAQRRFKMLTETDGLPPWLEHFRGVLFDINERFLLPHSGQAKSALDHVDDRVIKLQPAIETAKLREIMSADDPDRVLNKVARDLGPHVNETRFRLWFYLYLAFDFRKWVLLPPWNDGQWDRRDKKYASSTPGRPGSKAGIPRAERLSQQDIDLMCEGFVKHCQTGDTWADVWARVARKCFGATVAKVKNKRKYHVERGDRLFPVRDQFRRGVIAKFGRDRVRAHFIGSHRFRSDEQPFLGSLSGDLINIGERAHFDSSAIPERPKAFLGNYHLDPLHVVHLVDGLSGQILGIGFSLGSEQGRAYKAALFCAAIPKSVFGRIIGYPISNDDWPEHGLPAELNGDGGAGFSSEVTTSYGSWGICASRVPSYSPMSNASVESKHQRRTKRQGPPEIRLSQLNINAILKREGQLTIKKNRSDNILARASDRAIVEAEVRSPNDLHRYMHERARSSFIQIPFDDAVRAFLEPLEVKVQRGRIYFHKQEYTPERTKTSALTRELANRSGLSLKAYALDYVTLFIWVEWAGKLYELKAVTDGSDPVRFSSVQERQRIEVERARASGDTQAALPIEVFSAQESFFKETGLEMSAGRTVRGGKKRSNTDAEDEMRRIKNKENS